MLIFVLWALAAGCGGEACPEGQVRQDGVCEDYTAGEPVPTKDAWSPSPGTSWQWQLSGTVDTSLDVEMYDIDFQRQDPGGRAEGRGAGGDLLLLRGQL